MIQLQIVFKLDLDILVLVEQKVLDLSQHETTLACGFCLKKPPARRRGATNGGLSVLYRVC